MPQIQSTELDLVFDLDNTLYPASAGVTEKIDQLILSYLETKLGLSTEDANSWFEKYYQTWGLVLLGLVDDFSIDAYEYLAYTHNINLENYIEPNRPLDLILSRLPNRKSIFTNSPLHHAKAVLSQLGIGKHFSDIFYLNGHDLNPKPKISSYFLVLQTLERNPHDVIFFDDKLENLVPAKSIGMFTVWINEANKSSDHVDLHAPRIELALEELIDTGFLTPTNVV